MSRTQQQTSRQQMSRPASPDTGQSREPLGKLTAGAGSFADLAAAALLITEGWFGGMVAGGVGVVLGAIRLVLLRGRPIGRKIVLPVLIIAVGCALLTFSAQRYFAAPANSVTPESGSAAGPASAPAVIFPSDSSIAPSTSASSVTQTDKTLLFAGQVKLRFETGADIDAGQREGKDVSGPNGAVDLYLGRYTSSLLANGSDFYADNGPDKDAHLRCSKSTVSQPSPYSSVSGIVGQQYCFLTSNGNIAWLRINDANVVGGAASDYVVVNVKVWPK